MPRTLPPVMPTSTRDAAVNTDPITIGDLRPAAGVTSRTPISLAESMVIGLAEEKSPSPTHHVPRPPSQPRPPNMPRRNSPLATSFVLSSSVVRDGATSNTDDDTVRRSVRSLVREEHECSESPENSSSQIEMQHQERTFEGGHATASDTFVTQTGRVETGVGPELTTRKEEQERDAAELTARAAAEEEERRKKDLLLAKLRAMDEGRPTDSASQQPTLHETREQPNHAMSAAEEQTTMAAALEVETRGNLPGGQSAGELLLDSKVVSDGLAVEKVPRQEKPPDTDSLISKSSSQHSWNQRVENLHSGRPALSTDRDYYGTQSAGKRAADERQKAADTDHNLGQENGYAPSVGSHSSQDRREGSGNSLSRRHKPPLTGSLSKLEANGDIPQSSRQKLADDLEDGYQPSFEGPKKAEVPRDSVPTGRQAASKTLPLKFGGKKKGYPWETNVPVFPQKKLGSEQSEAGQSSNSLNMLNSEPLLPRREREEPRNLFGQGALNSRHETVNDDDIEEVVL